MKPVTLQPRHIETLTAYANGMTPKQIARQRGVSTVTIYIYMVHIKHVLGANTGGHAVLLAIESGILKINGH